MTVVANEVLRSVAQLRIETETESEIVTVAVLVDADADADMDADMNGDAVVVIDSLGSIAGLPGLLRRQMSVAQTLRLTDLVVAFLLVARATTVVAYYASQKPELACPPLALVN